MGQQAEIPLYGMNDGGRRRLADPADGNAGKRGSRQPGKLAVERQKGEAYGKLRQVRKSVKPVSRSFSSDNHTVTQN